MAPLFMVRESRRRLELDGSAVREHQLARNVQAQPQPGGLRRAALPIAAPEGVEQRVVKMIRDRRPIVVHRDADRLLLRGRCHADAAGASAVHDGIPDQIGEDLLQPVHIPAPRQGRALQLDHCARMSRPQLVDRRAQDRAQIARLRLHLDAAREATARQIENLLDHARHPARARVDAVQNTQARRIRGALPQDAEPHVHGSERIAQVMAQNGQETLLELLNASLLLQRGVLRGERAQPLLCVPALGQVARHLREADQRTFGMTERRDHDVRPEPRAILPDAPALALEASLALGHLQLRVADRFPVDLRRIEHREVLADDLLREIPLDALGPRVPGGDAAVEVEDEDRVVPDALDE
ncbi:MAG TPA: hypothetical protein VFS67_15325 [Polyangiaceae bacterium]|nr:hypothetical protein [Polyangiaceae bacterium]